MNEGATVKVPLERRLGAFYTPDSLASVVAAWAIAGQRSRLLDPSFGGCSFLRAGLAELCRNDVPDPASLIHGIDIDDRALSFAQELFTAGVPRQNIVINDFFATSAADVGGSFDVVLGNPPYIRHHWFKGRSRDRARAIAERRGVHLDGRASAWVYFVVHCVNFLNLGGRLAQLLPGAVLQADYASDFLGFLHRNFRTVKLIRMRQRQFPEAQEETVVLLATGFGRRSRSDVQVLHVNDTLALDHLLGSGDSGESAPVALWRTSLLTREQREAWTAYREAEGVRALGSIGSVRIGTVTGANDFFHRTVAHTNALGVDAQNSVVAVPNQKWFRGLDWTSDDQEAADNAAARTRLLVLRTRARNKVTRDLIEAAEANGLHLRAKCRCRHPWHVLTDVEAPDAFLPYMSARSPRIIANSGRAACVNSIHRLVWRHADHDPTSIAVGSVTSAFALAAEIYGRTYGGGVLKLEPRDALALPVATVEVSPRSCAQIDEALRQRDYVTAQRLADEAVLCGEVGLTRRQIKALHQAVQTLAEHR